MNAVVFLQNGLLATAAGKVVAMWDVNACAMKHTLNHEGTVRQQSRSRYPRAVGLNEPVLKEKNSRCPIPPLRR